MRGQNWQYLSDWALVTMTGIAATWLLIVALGCAWNRANKKGICSKVLELLLDVLK
jgi:Na+/pantothenate symporter